MDHPLKPVFTHTYTVEMEIEVKSNSNKATDVTAGDMWAAILLGTDMSDEDFLSKVGSPTHTEKEGFE